MSKMQALICAPLPDGMLPCLTAAFPEIDFIDAREPAVLDRHVGQATLSFGLIPVPHLSAAGNLRWLQLASAGVPQDLCPVAQRMGIKVTNLAGLYGPSIAEHALALMTILVRNLAAALRNQVQRRWDRGVARAMSDLHGRTVAIIGLGNIGQAVARLARAYGMRVVGCRRREQPVPLVDRVYPVPELRTMLAEADHVVVAAPLTARTEGMLGAAELAAMKRGAFYINVSRGAVAQRRVDAESDRERRLHSGDFAPGSVLRRDAAAGARSAGMRVSVQARRSRHRRDRRRRRRDRMVLWIVLLAIPAARCRSIHHSQPALDDLRDAGRTTRILAAADRVRRRCDRLHRAACGRPRRSAIEPTRRWVSAIGRPGWSIRASAARMRGSIRGGAWSTSPGCRGRRHAFVPTERRIRDCNSLLLGLQ